MSIFHPLSHLGSQYVPLQPHDYNVSYGTFKKDDNVALIIEDGDILTSDEISDYDSDNDLIIQDDFNPLYLSYYHDADHDYLNDDERLYDDDCGDY